MEDSVKGDEKKCPSHCASPLTFSPQKLKAAGYFWHFKWQELDILSEELLLTLLMHFFPFASIKFWHKTIKQNCSESQTMAVNRVISHKIIFLCSEVCKIISDLKRSYQMFCSKWSSLSSWGNSGVPHSFLKSKHSKVSIKGQRKTSGIWKERVLFCALMLCLYFTAIRPWGFYKLEQSPKNYISTKNTRAW